MASKPVLPRGKSRLPEALAASRDTQIIEALAQAMAYNGIPDDLPRLRVVAEGIIRDLAMDGIYIGRDYPK